MKASTLLSFASTLVAATFATMLATAARAQEFPSRPIRVIVPFPAGGPTDWLGRAVGEQLAKRVGQPAIVENRPGAGGYTGAEAVARADADGHTILLSSNGMVSYPLFLKDNKLDPLKSFAPLSITMETPWIIVTTATVPAKTLAAYIAHARANPGKLNFATITNSTQQLDTIRFLRQAAINIELINYNGTAPVYTALLANEVQGYFGAYSAIAPHARTGKLVPLAVASSKRLSMMPAVPTAKEAGLDYEAYTWFGFFAPAGTPAARTGKLASEIASIATSDLADKIRELGYEPVGSTPETMARSMAKDHSLYAEMATAIGVKPQ